MADKFAALLRGINVGRAKRISMADLKATIEALGYRDVRTLLNSGNVVLTASRTTVNKIATRIEEALTTELGVQARVTVLTAKEVNDFVAENPLVGDDPSKMLVSVLKEPADLAMLESLTSQDWKPEGLALGRRVVYMWCPDGILKSKAADAVNRVLRDGVTSRNWATTLKLHALLQ